jgi:hypothetical protein
MFTTVLPSILPVHHMMANIVMQVTTLTQMPQVVELIILFVPIHMCRSQYNHASGFRMRLTIFGATPGKFRTTLTCIT